MANTTHLVEERSIGFEIFLIGGLLFFAIAAIAILGVNGLFLAIALLLGAVFIPFLYNRPSIFLFFGLFAYPFSRFLPLDDKFTITAVLYLTSLPCALWVVKKYFAKVSVKSFYLWTLLAYLAVLGLNMFRPDTNIIEPIKDIGRGIFSIFTVLAVYDYVSTNSDNLKKLTYYISYAVNTIAVIALAQYFTGMGGISKEGFYRIRGTFFNYNDYAFVLAIFICFALTLLLNSSTVKQKIYWVATILLNCMALMGTFSKTAMVNTLLAFFVMSMFLPWKRKIQLFGSLIGLGVLLGAYVVLSGNMTALVNRFTDTSSLSWRYEIWNTLWNMILQGNLLIGQGANASQNYLQLVVPRGESFAPHNVFMETMYNFGLVGLIPFILTFVCIIFQGIGMLLVSRAGNVAQKVAGASIIVLALIGITQNFASNAFYDRAGNIIFWSILAVLIAWGEYYSSSKEKV